MIKKASKAILAFRPFYQTATAKSEGRGFKSWCGEGNFSSKISVCLYLDDPRVGEFLYYIRESCVTY